MKKKMIALIIDLILLLFLFFFMCISPYRYEWDESIKQVDPDKVLVLLLIWSVLGLVTIVVSFVKIKVGLYLADNRYAKVMSVLFGVSVLMICIYNIIKTLLL